MLNKVQSKSVVVTSYRVWTNKDPYFSHLKIWGYPAYKKRTLSNKLGAKSDRCLFVGYPKEILDISSTSCWNKSCLFQSIQSSQRTSLF